MSTLEEEIKLINTDWKDVIELETKKPYWNLLSERIDKITRENIYPPRHKIFECFKYFNVIKTKVVILGQDPYPTPGDANGLAFSVSRSYKLPPSLRNIFKELFDDLNIKKTSGDLSNWANQGVMLLNSALTFNRSNSDFLQLWDPFTRNIVSLIDNSVFGVVFVLWGRFAQSYYSLIKNNISYVVSSGHPSFAQSHKQFFGTRPFSKTNNYLESLNKKPIDW